MEKNHIQNNGKAKGKIYIGLDHGYGNIKTAHRVFTTGVEPYDEEPIVSTNFVKYREKYYVIGESHLVYQGNKTDSDDFYILTLAGLAEELKFRGLTLDSVFTTILDKKVLASQPTMSRFTNRCDEICLYQFDLIAQKLRQKIYSWKKPKQLLIDIDSSLFSTYGSQEGNSYNTHYSDYGYHPLLAYDGLTGDLLRAKLRPGSSYTSKDTTSFLEPLLDEFQQDYPDIPLFLRGDSGFADVLIYEKLESNGISYVIRMKESGRLRKAASFIEDELFEKTKHNQVDYAVSYGEFYYKADSWLYPRRIVCKIEKPLNQMIFLYSFIVTNMEGSPEDLILFYCKRGQMENFIRESKYGFNIDSMGSHSMIVNANKLQISMLAYNLFNWFKRLVLPKKI